MSANIPQPIVTVDVVLLTLKDDELLAALTLRDREPCKGELALPGGWVHIEEDEDDLAAAVRILKNKAGLDSPYFEQLKTFANRHRDSRGWSVSIAHYALVPYEAVQSVQHDHLEWRSVDAIRSLPFDHLEILRTAVSRVRSKTLYSSLPVHLMPKTFSLTELQHVYERLLGGALDKRSFRRRIEELDIIEPAPGKPTARGAHRPAQLYQVKRRFGQGLALADRNLGRKTA
jgi:8-oxo-dGTP diphosphatase